MSRIFIKNSNLFLEKLDYNSNPDTDPEIFPALVAQNIMIEVNGNKVIWHKDTEPDDGYWRLYRGSKRFTTTKSYYSPEERRAILGFLKYWESNGKPQHEQFLDIEALLYATGREALIEELYEFSGHWSDFVVFLHNINAETRIDEEYRVIPFSSSYTADRQEYTITDLIDDLVKDRSNILVDSELLGKYTKISRAVIDTESSLEVDYESWNPIVKKTSHSSRANLSITYSVPVSIEVPENTFTTPGRRNLTSLRSICIIRDGLLWSPKIAVKVNSMELRDKLASSPAFIDNILSPEEFILDLTVLPISHFDPDYKYLLSDTEIKVLITELELQYYRTKEYMLRKSLTVAPDKLKQDKRIQTEEEKYLATLGIYGTTYIPKQTKTEKTGDEYTAKTLCISSPDFGNKKDYWSSAIKKYIDTGKPLVHYLSLCILPKEKTLEEWRELIKEHTEKLDNLKKYKNDLVFSVLLQKDFEFQGKRNSSIKVTGYTVNLRLIKETIPV